MEQQITFRSYGRAIRRRWWLLLLLAFVAVIAVFFRVGAAPPQYVGVTTLMVTAPPVTRAPVVAGAQEPAAFSSDPTTILNTILKLLETQTIAQRVGRRMQEPDLQKVRQSLLALVPRNTDMVEIRGTAEDPERAAAYANTAAAELIAYFRQTNSRDAREARRFVERQLGQVRGELDASDRALLEARRNVAALEGASSTIITNYYSAQSALEDARRGFRETAARLSAAVIRLSAEAPTVVSETATEENPTYRQLQSKLVDLEIQRSQMAQVYTDQHPTMQALDSQIQGVRGRLAQETQTRIGRETRSANPLHTRLKQDIATLEMERAARAAQISSLAQVERQRRAALEALPPAQYTVARLLRENQILEARYRLLAERFQEALLFEHVASFLPAGIQVVEWASAPWAPQATALPRVALAAALAGLLLGVLAAIFLESGDTRLRTAGDVERALGVPVLAEIPHARSRYAVATATASVLLVALLLGAGVSIHLPSALAAAGTGFGRGGAAGPSGLARVVRAAQQASGAAGPTLRAGIDGTAVAAGRAAGALRTAGLMIAAGGRRVAEQLPGLRPSAAPFVGAFTGHGAPPGR